MSRIRGRNTTPELLLRKALWAEGLRYRLHYKIEGKPDICFPGKRIAIFVDGCFWHGCPDHSNLPKNNAEFWETKLSRNVSRDRQVNDLLTSQGWLVIRFWEHEIKNDIHNAVADVIQAFRSRQ
jgi:DNA mismatch endonuclease, patch repair protein